MTDPSGNRLNRFTFYAPPPLQANLEAKAHKEKDRNGLQPTCCFYAAFSAFLCALGDPHQQFRQPCAGGLALERWSRSLQTRDKQQTTNLAQKGIVCGSLKNHRSGLPLPLLWGAQLEGRAPWPPPLTGPLAEGTPGCPVASKQQRASRWQQAASRNTQRLARMWGTAYRILSSSMF